MPVVFLLLFSLLLVGCLDPSATTFADTPAGGFELNVMADAASRQLLDDQLISCSDCEVNIWEAGGRPALRLRTTSEFSDLRIDLAQALGHPINLYGDGFLYFDVFLPGESDIYSVKFNQGDAAGNFGGCGNYVNNLGRHRNQWLSVEVPLAEQAPYCRNWTGEDPPFAATSVLTVNPYNANRVDSATLFINNIRFSPERIPGDYHTPRLAPEPEVPNNNPYVITFDDDELLDQQLAIRAFEATTQHITTGKFGNESRAIRSYGTGENRFICWLPDIERMTGHPVNFHEVDSLYFRYYLTPESDSVGGATLFVTTGDDWEGILMDTTFMAATDFVRGEWSRYAVALDHLDFVQHGADLDVLSAVYEMRVDLHYDKSAGPIEMWWDDFGWK